MDPKNWKKGLKFDKILIAQTTLLKFVIVREPEILTEPRTEQPYVRPIWDYKSIELLKLELATKI